MILFLKLISYEIKKVYSVSVIRYAFLFFFLTNIVLCSVFLSSNKNNTIPENLITPVYDLAISDPLVYRSEYEHIENLTVSDMLPSAPVYGNSSFSDMTIFYEVQKLVENNKTYENKINSVISDAERILSSLQIASLQDSYTKEYQKGIISIYSELVNSVSISTEYIYGWDCYFDYSYDFVITIIVVLFLTSIIFHEDKNIGFIQICNISKNGRYQSSAAKVIVLLICCFVFSLLFSITNFILIGSMIGFSDGATAIQSLPSFYLFPLPLNFFEYAIINFLLKFMAVFFSALIFSVIALFLGSLLYYLTSTLFLAIEFVLYQYDSITMGQWKYLNIFSVAHPHGILNRYRSVNVFGSSIDIINILLSGFFIVVTATIFIIIITYSKTTLKKITIKIPLTIKFTRSPATTKITSSTSFPLRLYQYELIKMKWWIFLVALFVIFKCIISFSFFTPIDSSYERMKLEYMSILEGPYTQDKENFILERISEYTNIIIQYDSMKLSYWNNTISEEEYSQYISSYTKAQGEINVLYDLYDHSQFLKRTETGWFIYDSGISKYITQPIDYLLVICVCSFCGMIFISEFQNKTSEFPVMSIVSTTKNGRRKLFITKIYVCLISSCLMYLIFFAIDLFSFVHHYGLIPLNAPLSSCQSVSQSIWSLSFIQYFLLVFFIGFLGVCILSALFTTLSYLFKHLHFILLVIISSILIPSILSVVVSNSFSFFNITSISDGRILLLLSSSMTSIFYVYIIIIIVLLLYMLFSAFLMFLALRQLKE